MEPGGRNFKIPSPPLLAIFCVSPEPFCAPLGVSCPPLENLRAPLKFCPCAVCASCDRAALDGAKSLSLEFCSKFIAKFKIISLKLASSPREIGICAVFCGANFKSYIRRARDDMSLDDASKFKRLRHSKRAQRNKEPMQKTPHGQRGDTTQRRERIGYFGYEGRERAAYRGAKILRTAYLQL